MEKIKIIKRRYFLKGALLTPLLLVPGKVNSATRDVAYYSARSDLFATLACARMALSNYDHVEHYPVEDVDDMIFHREGYFVFEAQLMPILLQKGYKVKLHSKTPYKDLADGKDLDRYGKKAEDKIDEEALKWAAKFLNDDNFKSEEVSFNKAVEWFEKGEFVMIGVSRNILRNDASLPYCRYNIVITGTDKNKICYHDPSFGPSKWAEKEFIKKAFEHEGTDRAVLHFGAIV